MQHGKEITEKPQPDGSIVKTTNSYYRGILSAEKTELIEHFETSYKSFLKDYIEAAKPVSDGRTERLTIEIKCDPYTKAPTLISRTYVLKKANYNKHTSKSTR